LRHIPKWTRGEFPSSHERFNEKKLDINRTIDTFPDEGLACPYAFAKLQKKVPCTECPFDKNDLPCNRWRPKKRELEAAGCFRK